MRLIVMSDSHGNNESLRRILAAEPQADAYIHCGDLGDAGGLFPQLTAVAGNNDLYYSYPDHRVLDFDGFRILVCHSHQFATFGRYEGLAKWARELDCQMVMFGHTHVYHYSVHNGIYLLNPGSCWLNRNGDRPCYAEVTLRSGKPEVRRREVG